MGAKEKDRYAEMTDDDFDRILGDLIEENAHTLLSIPGVYEATSENFNNEVLTRWEIEQGLDPEEE
jgi:uncharacterized protein YfbU (UPF0304 family)